MSATQTRPGVQAPVETLAVSAFTVPTDEPESDGTAEWDSTTIVVVELRGGGKTGLGYTYAPAAAGKLVEEKLAEVVEGPDGYAIAGAWEAMVKGDPERAGVMEKSLKGKLVELTEHLKR